MKEKIKKFRYYFKYFAKKNIIIIIMLVFACPIIAHSYSAFIFNTNHIDASQMYIGKLLYSIRIDGISTNSVMVPANSEVEAVVQVTSLNQVGSNYKLAYNTINGVSAVYASDENNPAYGLITTINVSTILITNTTSEAQTITFDVIGGYQTNELATIVAPSNHTLVMDSYMKYDYETLAIFIDGTRVNSLDSSKTYNLTSYTCTNGETVTYNKITRTLSVTPSDEQTKCQLYFEEYLFPTITEKIIATTTPKSDASVDFTAVASTASTSGLYYTSRLEKNEDINNDGIGENVYYYRGVINNNYLIYASLCFRIVRTNEDGSVRLRYSGIPTLTSGVYTCPQGSTDVGINNNELIKYNQTYVDNAYFGYMMGMDNQCLNTTQCVGSTKSTSVEAAQTNTYNSNVKQIIDKWFEDNIVTKGTTVTSKLANAIYCNDRTFYYGRGYNSYEANYTANQRIALTTGATGPQYKCPKLDDAKYGSLNNTYNNSFTLSVAQGGTQGYGNNKLTYPVALLTADEVTYAGGAYGKSNYAFYLYTPSQSWLMTPHSASDGSIHTFVMANNAAFYNGYLYEGRLVMPVLSLKSNTTVKSGTGVYNNPYIVD